MRRSAPAQRSPGFGGPIGPSSEGDLDAVSSGWHDHTEAGFTLHTLPGGHLFFLDHLPVVAELIEKDLLTP
jgi:hypothetical protein